MSTSEIDISHLFPNEDFTPFDCSNNAATLGDDAGRLTWEASKEAATAIASLLPTPEHKQQFTDFVRSSGGWSEEEIAAWSDHELDALLLQWIAGDVREAFGDAEPSEWDWEEYQRDYEAGRKSGRIYKGDDGKIWFNISE